MKTKFLVLLFLAISTTTFAQVGLGGMIRGYNNAGTAEWLMMRNNGAKMWDSIGNVYNLAQKLKLDSIYTKINSSIAVTMTGHDSTTDSRIGVKLLQNPTITNTSFGISGTLPGFASTPTFNIGSGGYAVSASDSNKYRIAYKVIESALPVGGSTSALQTSGNTLLQGIKTHDSNIYVNTDAANIYLASIESSADSAHQSLTAIETWTDNNTLARTVDSTQSVGDGSNGYLMYGVARSSSPSAINGNAAAASFDLRNNLRVILQDPSGNYVAAGGGGGGGSSITALRDSSSTPTSMTMTGISAMASRATVGWQSDTVNNLTRKAIDYKIMVRISMQNNSPASDKACYIYLIPWTWDGTNWRASSIGTTTLPSGSAGTMTITQPVNLRLLGVLNYNTADMVLQDTYLLSNAFGDQIPDMFSIGVINFSGATVETTSGTNNLITYTPIYKTNR